MARRTWIEVSILAGLGMVGYFVLKNSGTISDALSGLIAGAYNWPPASAPYKALVQSSAQNNGVPVALMAAEITKESGWNPNAYNAKSGATGIAQFEPPTAADLGIDPTDPNQAIPAMAQYLASLNGTLSGMGYPEWSYTLAAYDWGIGNVQRALADGTPPSAWPSETRNYVRRITAASGVDTATAALFA